MSIQQNFPAISPSLSLNFARSKTLDPRITFTRTSTATRVNGQGLIEVVSADTPRFDHKYENGVVKSLGLLVEEQRVNYIRYSEELDNSSLWSKNGVGISTNNSISPTGELTSEKIIDAAGVAGNQHWLRIRAPGLSTTGTYTASSYLKFDPTNTNTRHFSITITDAETGGSSYSAVAITTTGTYTITSNQFANTTAGITVLPNGWYRAHLTFTNAGIANELSLRFVLLNGSNSSVYDSDGSSGVFVWGAQLEQGSFPTSYIPTTNSTATRTADNASMTGSNFSSWFNQGDGTFLINGSAPYQFQRSFGVSAFNTATVNDNRLSIRMGNTFMRTNAVEQFGFYQQQSTNSYKVAVAYGTNTASQVLNAVIAGTDTSVITPSNYDVIEIGKVESNTSLYTNGAISQLTYYPRRLTNIQLQNLTK